VRILIRRRLFVSAPLAESQGCPGYHFNRLITKDPTAFSSAIVMSGPPKDDVALKRSNYPRARSKTATNSQTTVNPTNKSMNAILARVVMAHDMRHACQLGCFRFCIVTRDARVTFAVMLRGQHTVGREKPEQWPRMAQHRRCRRSRGAASIGVSPPRSCDSGQASTREARSAAGTCSLTHPAISREHDAGDNH